MNDDINIRRVMRDAGSLPKDILFFEDRIKKYPFMAQAPSSVKPPIVPGNHMSVRLRYGWRIWGFETEVERDTFIVQFGGRMFP